MVLPDRLCEVSCCSHTALAALLWTFCAFFSRIVCFERRKYASVPALCRMTWF